MELKKKEEGGTQNHGKRAYHEHDVHHVVGFGEEVASPYAG